MDDSVVESVLDAERRLASLRQILSINIPEENIAAANELILQQRAERLSKRTSSRLESQIAKKNKLRERNIADIYSFIDLCEARSPKERAIKDIYKHIIQQH
ncbi:hypothetical protein G6F37_006282 [Rhizopus arrhizus]|nr:hypothetical protein G6F38_006348 [Rhizopus arrhizus]KAG1157913.1 hypothetical protein G6F37_006282 [Rhizopus arrhizus]